MAWQQPKTTWGQAGQTVPGATDFNRIEGNTQYLKDALDSHKADYEYKPATVVGTQIRVQKQSNTAIVKFRLNNDVTGGFITISLDGGVTSKPLKNIDGEDITELEKGFVEVVEDTVNFTYAPKGGGLDEFFGDGSDGVLDTNSNVILECAQDAPLIKQYKSIKINAGHTLTTNNRCARLILYSQSDVVIDGIIGMSKKGWRYSIRNNSLPAVIYGRNRIAPTPVGGDGGNGGDGGGYSGGKGKIGGRGTTLGSGKGGGGGGGKSEAWGGGGSMLAYGGNGGSAEFTYTKDYNLAGRGSGGYASGSANDDDGGNAINSGGGGGGAAVYGYTAASAYGGYGGYGYWAGGGGGGGAATTALVSVTADSGGNGEYGGGNVVIIAKGNVIIGAGGKILCNGGNGGNGGTGDAASEDYSARGYNGGGGGGAGGGTIVILHKGTFINNGEFSVAGGLGGYGGYGYYAGQNGTSGTVGTIIVQQITD